MGTAQPVTANSLRATPSGTIGDFGSLAVDINGRTGAGQAGIPVTITPDATAAANGGVTTTATTNDKGCVHLRLHRHRPLHRHVLQGRVRPGRQPQRRVGDRDRGGGGRFDRQQVLPVRPGRAGDRELPDQRAFGNATTWTTSTNGTGFTIGQAPLGTPRYQDLQQHRRRTRPPAAWSTSPSPRPTRPGPASVRATSRRPGAHGLDSLTIPPGGTGTADRARVPPARAGPAPDSHLHQRHQQLRLHAQRRQDAGPLHPDDARLHRHRGRDLDQQHRQRHRRHGTSSYSTWEAIVPWGSYTSAPSTPTARATGPRSPRPWSPASRPAATLRQQAR